MFSQSTRRIVASNAPPPIKTSFSTGRRSLFRAASSPISQSPSTNARLRTIQLPSAYPSTHVRFISFSHRLRRGYRVAAKDIWRNNPIVLPVAVISIIAASAFFTYVFYVQAREVNPHVTRFPDPVANELRKALYYTEVNLEPQKAIDHYKEALRKTSELGMHPYSDEVIGIKLQTVDMLVKAGLHKQAVALLSKTSVDALAWVDKTRLRLSLKSENSFMKGNLADKVDPNVKEIFGPKDEDSEYESRLTTKTVKKVIGMHLLLAQLWEDEHLREPIQAFVMRRAALNIFKREIAYRQKRDLPPVATAEEGEDWMNAEEVSHAMSDVGSTWIRAGRPEKALELLLPAVAILRQVEGKDISCRQVILLSNIAAAMFDHRPPKDGTSDKKTPVIPIEKQMQSSKDWALKAIEVSKLIKEDLRDEECDMGCAAAADVLSAIAEWEGADDDARKWLLEEKRYCESAQYAEGIEKVSKLLADAEQRHKQRKP